MESMEIGKVESVTLCCQWRELDMLIDERLRTLRNLEWAWTKHIGYKRKKGDSNSLPLTYQQPRGSNLPSFEDNEQTQQGRNCYSERRVPRLRIHQVRYLSQNQLPQHRREPNRRRKRGSRNPSPRRLGAMLRVGL